MKVAAVILAGGEGRRMGGGKPLRALAGRTLLARAAERACAWSDCAAIAIRDAAQAAHTSLPLIVDEAGIAGPLGGLVAGLRFASDRGRDALLTLPADMPFLPDDLGARLALEIGGHGAAIAASDGHAHPVCALWRCSVIDLLPAYLATGRRSLMGLAELAGHCLVEWPGGPGDPFFNINSPDDLAKAERRLRL